MADLWSGPAVRLWLDEMSTDSTENEASLRWAQELGASELIVVSSWWHLRLPLSCRGARGLGIKVRWKSSKRMSGLSGHLRRELRYLPRALRHGTNRSTRSARPVGPVDEQQIASRLLQLQRQAELGVLRGGRGHRARPV